MKRNFFTGYLRHREVKDFNTAKELDRQHNIGLLKGTALGLLSLILAWFLYN